MMNDWSGMEGYSLLHWLAFAATVAVILYPIGRILGRIGLSPFWCLVALIPFINLIALWALAFGHWPCDTDKSVS